LFEYINNSPDVVVTKENIVESNIIIFLREVFLLGLILFVYIFVKLNE